VKVCVDAKPGLKFQGEGQRVQVIGQNHIEFALGQDTARSRHCGHPVIDPRVAARQEADLVRRPTAGIIRQGVVAIHSFRGTAIAAGGNTILAFEQFNLLEDPGIRSDG
jgi:hypothetical protein